MTGVLGKTERSADSAKGRIRSIHGRVAARGAGSTGPLGGGGSVMGCTNLAPRSRALVARSLTTPKGLGRANYKRGGSHGDLRILTAQRRGSPNGPTQQTPMRVSRGRARRSRRWRRTWRTAAIATTCPTPTTTASGKPTAPTTSGSSNSSDATTRAILSPQPEHRPLGKRGIEPHPSRITRSAGFPMELRTGVRAADQ